MLSVGYLPRCSQFLLNECSLKVIRRTYIGNCLKRIIVPNQSFSTKISSDILLGVSADEKNFSIVSVAHKKFIHSWKEQSFLSSVNSFYAHINRYPSFELQKSHFSTTMSVKVSTEPKEISIPVPYGKIAGK